MSVYRLVQRADDDLDEIWLTIAMDDPDAATRFIEELHHSFELLGEFPNMGRSSRRRSNLYTFPHRRYIITYRIIEDGIEILRIIHSARLRKR